MAPTIRHINAIDPLMFMLKWMLKAVKNINTPPEAIIWMLDLKLIRARIKHVIVDNNTPIKKKYNSTNSFGGNIFIKIKIVIKQFRINGIIRWLTFSRYMDSACFILLSKKKIKIGNIIVKINSENNFALIMGIGIYLGAFEK